MEALPATALDLAFDFPLEFLVIYQTGQLALPRLSPPSINYNKKGSIPRPFTEGETEAIGEALDSCLLLLDFLGFWTLLPAPSMAYTNSPPPTPGLQWSNSRADIAMATTAHKASPLGFSTRPLSREEAEGLPPLGTSRERSRKEVRPSWLLICFPNKKMGKADNTASKCSTCGTEWAGQRWSSRQPSRECPWLYLLPPWPHPLGPAHC